MAESCAPLLVAGYENEFVDSIPDTLSCPVCLLPFRDPHLVSCCGAKFCEPCIGRVKAAGQPCPLCKQEFISLLDRSFQRKVLELKVRCSTKSDGCQWVGELRHVVPHEKEECEWAVVGCSYQCGAHLPRRLMAEHEHDMCPQRPMDVKLECFMRLMETKLTTERERHERELSAVKEELRREREAHTIEIAELKQLMESKMAEQKKETETKMAKQIKKTESKMAEQMESKMTEQKKDTERKMAELTESKIAEQKKDMERKMAEQKKEMKNEYVTKAEMMVAVQEKLPEAVEEAIKKIDVTAQKKGILISSRPVPPIELIMTQYSTHKKNRDYWYSPPFYTGPEGYKMCIRVNANNVWMLQLTSCMSVSVYLMRGEFDSMLKWPFRGDITIQLVNHNNGQDHHEKTAKITFGERVTSGEIADTGQGFGQFITHTMVESSTKTRRYLDNDCLTFRVTKAVVHTV